MNDDDQPAYHVPTVVGSLILGVFFGGVGGGVAFPTLPTLGTVLGISPFLVGVILSTNRFTRLLINTPAGQVIDKIGTRKPMIIGFILQGLAPFGYIVGLYPEYIPFFGAAEIFIFARVIWGFGSAFVFVGAFSIVIHVTSMETRGKWIGYFRGGQSLGFPTGLILGGLLTDVYSYEVAFGTAGMSGLVAAVVAALVLPDVSSTIQTPAKMSELPSIIMKDIRILMIGSVNFTVRFFFGGVLLSTIVLYAEAFGIGFGDISAIGISGIVMGVSVLSASVTTVISGNLSDRLDNRVLVTLPALGVFSIGFALLGLIPTLESTLIAVALIGVGVGGTNPPLLAFLGDISPAGDVGKLGGVYNVFGDLGATLGPLVALPFAATLGYQVEYLVCAAGGVALGLFVLYTLLTMSTEPVPAHIVADDD